MKNIIEKFSNGQFNCGERGWVWECPSCLETIHKEGNRYLKKDSRNGNYYLYKMNKGRNNLNSLDFVYFD